MIILDLDPGAPAFRAILVFCALPLLFNLPPLLGRRKSNIILALLFVPLFLYTVFITYFTVVHEQFYWSFRGDFLCISLTISLLNLLVITLLRKDVHGDL